MEGAPPRPLMKRRENGVDYSTEARTDIITHKVYLTLNVPVHNNHYPVPHRSHKYHENEVARMLKLGVI